MDSVTSVLPFIPLVVAFVAVVRTKVPKVDGILPVLGLALAISVAIVFAYGPELPLVDMAKRAVALALESVAAVWGIDRHADRSRPVPEEIPAASGVH